MLRDRELQSGWWSSEKPQKGGFRRQDITDCLNQDLLCLSRLTFAETHPHGDLASTH